MFKITFILGGARSGKSTYALELAKNSDKKVAFVATCHPTDEEMVQRVALHKQTRPKDWPVYEEPKDLAPLLRKIGSEYEVLIIDCLTLFVSNLMLEDMPEAQIEERVQEMIAAAKEIPCQVILVSNEVGLGIVPENALARRFRDVAGRVNQRVAKEAEEVFFMVSGIASKIK